MAMTEVHRISAQGLWSLQLSQEQFRVLHHAISSIGTISSIGSHSRIVAKSLHRKIETIVLDHLASLSSSMLKMLLELSDLGSHARAVVEAA